LFGNDVLIIGVNVALFFRAKISSSDLEWLVV
jgi:hypothetical protein